VRERLDQFIVVGAAAQFVEQFNESPDSANRRSRSGPPILLR
jgi:hypothetical protein